MLKQDSRDQRPNLAVSRLRRRGQAGFTLIEMLIATAIISLLAGVTVFAVGRAKDNARKNACLTERRAFETAANIASLEDHDIRSYISSTTGIYFEVSGYSSFDRSPTNPLNVNCL